MGAEYVFDTGSDLGRQQVDCLAEMLDGTTTGVLDGLGVRSGWRCLELGARNGSIAGWLARRTGSAGTVAAVDLDTSHVVADPNVEVHRHDLNDGLPLEGPFDLIHSRLVLMHLSRREEILDSLVDALAPGGWLVLGDLTDRLPLAASARDVADEELFERVIETGMNRVGRPAGMNLEWARDTGRHMARSGLEDIHSVEYRFTAYGGTPGLLYYRSMLAQVGHLLLKAGISEGELRRFDELMTDPRFSAWSYQFVFTWGRRQKT
ncbi:class I SAM-dependent methyltransferase [Sciscionella marina]|uniref:class I SAM-dependent methyltransferase n=1 Tax=Sciscionella marina TaxID=508770 RepID=UPI000374D9D1|nr:class I SAM-dependent methyltransferase [Sciscionella marina]